MFFLRKKIIHFCQPFSWYENWERLEKGIMSPRILDTPNVCGFAYKKIYLAQKCENLDDYYFIFRQKVSTSST